MEGRKTIRIVTADTDRDIKDIAEALQRSVPSAEKSILHLGKDANGEDANPFPEFDPEKEQMLLVGHSGWMDAGGDDKKTRGVAIYGSFTVNDTKGFNLMGWLAKPRFSTVVTGVLNAVNKLIFGSFANAFNKKFEAAYKQKHEAALKGMNKEEKKEANANYDDDLKQAKEQEFHVYLAGCEAGLMTDIEGWVSSAQHIANDLHKFGFKNVVIHTVVNPVLEGVVDMRVGFGISEGNNVVASYLITSTQNERLTALMTSLREKEDALVKNTKEQKKIQTQIIEKQSDIQKKKMKKKGVKNEEEELTVLKKKLADVEAEINAIPKIKDEMKKIDNQAVIYMNVRYEDLIQELDRPHNMIYPAQRVQEEPSLATPQKNIWQELALKSISDLIFKLDRIGNRKEIEILENLRVQIGNDKTGKEWARLINEKRNELSKGTHTYHWLDGLLDIAHEHGGYEKVKPAGYLQRIDNALEEAAAKILKDKQFIKTNEEIKHNFINALKTVQSATNKEVDKPKLFPYSAEKIAAERKAAAEKAKREAAEENERKKQAEELVKRETSEKKARKKEAKKKAKQETAGNSTGMLGWFTAPVKGAINIAMDIAYGTNTSSTNKDPVDVVVQKTKPHDMPSDMRDALNHIIWFRELLQEEYKDKNKRLRFFTPKTKRIKAETLLALHNEILTIFDQEKVKEKPDWTLWKKKIEEYQSKPELVSSLLTHRTKDLLQNIVDGKINKGILDSKEEENKDKTMTTKEDYQKAKKFW